MKLNLLSKLYCMAITALVIIGCSLKLSGDQGQDIPLISHAEELYVHNDSGSYFIQLEPGDAKIGHMTIFELMNSGNQRTDNSDEDSLVVSAYIHKFTYKKCDFTAFDIYRTANDELYYILKETQACPLKHTQQGYLEFADE